VKIIIVSAAIALVGAGNALAADQGAGNPVHGKQIFVRCAACHSIGEHAGAGIGPSLNGIVGRKAGTVPGYRYSSAMRRAGVTWDAATLAAFLQAPSKVVPGTRMTFQGLSKPEDEADVIAYLSQFAADGSEK
jgi:cytochrome c